MTIADLVERERARLGRVLGAGGVALTLATGAFVLAGAVVLLGEGRWMRLPPFVPVIAWIVALILAGVTAWVAFRRVAGATGRIRTAAAIESEQGFRRGAVRGALEVANAGPLGRYGARALAERLESRRALIPALYGATLRRSAVALALGAVALVALGASRRHAPDGWRAVQHPVLAWQGTLLPSLHIVAPRDVPRGHQAQVRIIAPGRTQITLSERITGSAWSATSYPVTGDTARMTTGPVDADLTLVAHDGRSASDTVLVQASDRPFIGEVTLRATYPAYLHHAPDILSPSDGLRLPRGTIVAIDGRASIPLGAIALVGGSRSEDTLSLHTDGPHFAGQLIAEPGASGHWVWTASSSKGGTVDLPQPFDLVVVPDSAPTVAIVAPAHDTVVSPTDRIVIALRASDDHGLADVRLRSWRVHGTGKGLRAELVQHVLEGSPPSAPLTQWNGQPVLDLSVRGLLPGDAMHVVAEAVDNSPWAQEAVSSELVLHVPSITEQRLLARAAADSAVAQATSVAAEQRQLAQRTAETARARALRGAPSGGDAEKSGPTGAQTEKSPSSQSAGSLSYASAAQVKELGSEQQAMTARVDSLRDQAQRLEQRLHEAGALDSGLAGRLSEVQHLLRDALTPELQQQLDQLNRAATALNASETQQSLSDLAQQQQRLREQLDKTVDLLKRAALEGAMQTAHDEAKDIANAERAQQSNPQNNSQQNNPQENNPQRTNAQQTNAQQTNPSGNQATAQQLADRSRALSQDVQQLAKRLADQSATTGAEKVGAARAPMDSSAREMEQRKPGNAAANMDRAAQQLADARRSQIEEWKSSLTSNLDRSVQETMQLASQERGLAQAAQRNSTDRSELAAQQSAVQQGVQRAQEQLAKAARQSALISQSAQQAMGQAGNQVQRATDATRVNQSAGGSTPEETAANMRSAAQALTNAASALARDRAHAAGASSASGLSDMLQQMQQLAQQQGKLNAQASSMSLVPGSQGGTGPGGQGNARGLGQGERQIAESLDRMEGGGDDPGGGTEALAREARQIADALERSGVDPGTIIRQQRLYHRLLDAGHTLEKDEQDSSAKRVAQAATGRELFLPTNTVAHGAAATKFPDPTWADLRSLDADDRQLVLDYFKRINAQ